MGIKILKIPALTFFKCDTNNNTEPKMAQDTKKGQGLLSTK
jgi:hypothetical protein